MQKIYIIKNNIPYVVCELRIQHARRPKLPKTQKKRKKPWLQTEVSIQKKSVTSHGAASFYTSNQFFFLSRKFQCGIL